MKWTQSEIRFLEENMHWTAGDIGDHLQRTEKSVRRKQEKLGLSFGPPKNYWTKKELDIVYAHKDISYIMKKLPHRSRSAIYSKLREIYGYV